MILSDHVNGQDLRQTVQAVSQATLPFEADGYKCTTEMVYDVLLKAASDGISSEAACQDMPHAVDGNTIRAVLNDHLDIAQIRVHEHELNQALASALPAQLHSMQLEGAIDLHDEPFYGKDEALRAVACRGKARDGTTRFVRTASAYVVYRQLRLTLAVTFVLPEDSTLEVVERLYQRLQALGVRLKVLYLDKGFCAEDVIGYLQRQRQPAVLACTIRGTTGGTRQLCRGRKSYRTRYTFSGGTTTDVALVATLPPGKEGKRRRKWLLFVVIDLDWPPHVIYRRYRRRFGIECAYRLARQVRIKTTSRNPMLRFFSFGFALLLVTIWAVLRWFIARIPGRGPHRVDPQHFQFRRFILLLRRAVEQVRGIITSLAVPCPPRFSIY